MLKIIQIEQLVPVESKYLDKNIEHHILDILKTYMNGYCSSLYGYIINVKRIINIGENKINSANSLVVFNIKYEADVLNPNSGDITEGIVSLVLQNGDGIMVNVQNKIQVLIPSTNMKPLTYNQFNISFESNSDNITINKGSLIKLEVVVSKYEKKQYTCIGKIKL